MNVKTILSDRRKRSSNIELLRILAMFLVLLVHSNFFSLGAPTQILCSQNPDFAFSSFFVQGLSICCVNLFVLISGWFGIRPKLKSFLNFLFQCLFFLVGIYIIMTIMGLTDISYKGILKGIAGCFFLLKWNWFIKAYICLYIIAPMINSYIDCVDKYHVRNFLVSFYIFQILYSWISDAAVFFESGYSTLSFIGLYTLARYSKLYPNRFTSFDKKIDLMIYLGISLLLAIVGYLFVVNNINFLTDKIFSYVNPLVILSALYLLLFFSKIKIHSSIINWIGASSFAVFLLHTNPNLCIQYFVPSVKFIVSEYNGFFFVIVLLSFLISIFLLAILIDQLRLVLWKRYLEPWCVKLIGK